MRRRRNLTGIANAFEHPLHVAGARGSVSRPLLEALHDQRRKGWWNARSPASDRFGNLYHVCGEERWRRAPGERRLASEHLVRHAPECVQVRPAVHRRVRGRLLGRHVRRGAKGHAELGDGLGLWPTVTGRGDSSGHAEIGDHGRTAGQHDIVRLDVAMHDTVFVCIGEGAGDVA